MTQRLMVEHNKEIEKVEQMGIEAAVKLLWERDAAVRGFRWNDRGVLWARHFRFITKLGCEALGVTVICDDLGNVEEVKLPVGDYFKEALKERAPVSEPGLPEDVSSHGYYDPCEEAILSNGVVDLGVFDQDAWFNGD
jgi:hypothetical protein